MTITTTSDVLQALQDLSSGKGFIVPSAPPIGSALPSQTIPSEMHTAVQNGHETRVGVSMLVGISYKSDEGTYKERDFLIRRIIQNKNDIYIDGVATDIRAPRLIKVSQIIQVRDIGTGRIYDNAYQFLQNKLGIHISNDILAEELPTFAEVIERLHNEITVLMYVVAIDGIREKTERNVVAAYVRAQTPDLTYTDTQLDEYLISIAPDATSAGMAFQKILAKDKSVLQPFIETLINVITANGEVDPKEQHFISKVMDLLETQGFKFDFGLS